VTPESLGPDDVEESLSPEDAEAVRRLLVAAGAGDAVPKDVAARLDDVLAGLQAEREGTATAPVTDLTARRTRRWPTVLVAAAAVVVVGAGIGNVMNDTRGAGDAATSGEAVAPDAGVAESAPEQDARGLSEDQDGDSASSAAPKAVLGDARTAALPRIRTGSATLDAQRIQDLALGAPVADGLVDQNAPKRSVRGSCDLPSPARGETLVAVRFDGKRASLLFRAPDAGRRDAEVYSCDDSDSPVLVTTVPAR
jgi:hypothetical protein